MKKRLIYGLVAASMLTLGACSSEDFPGSSSGTGHLSVNIGIDASVREQSRAEYSDVTVSDLTLKLTRVGSEAPVFEGQASGLTSDREIPVGSYTLEAVYGSAEEDGFECPYFYGSQTLVVNENELTAVNLTAKLSNALVKIEYTDAFKNYFASYKASILSAASRTTEFENDETRWAYIAPGTAKVFVDITKPNGSSATLQPVEFDAAAKSAYIVTLDVNNGAVGDATLSVTVNDATTVEPVEIELSDDLMNAPAPELTVPGFTIDPATHEVVIETIQGQGYNGDVRMSIMARGMIADVPMTTVSSDLVAQGWPAEVNLTKCQENQGKLSGLGLKVLGLWGNTDKMAVIDFNGVIANLSSTGQNRFTVYVKDKFTKVSDPVTLVFNVNAVTLSLNNQYMREGDDILTADLYYNGPDTPTLNDNVTIQVKNTRGTWTTAAYTYSQTQAKPAARSLENPLYHLTVTLPSDATDAPYQVRAVYHNTSTSETQNGNTITVTPVARELALAVAPNDVWAKSATVTINSLTPDYTAAQIAAQATVMVKAASASGYTTATIEHTSGSNAVRIVGLTPGTEYSAYAYFMGNPERNSVPVTFTTEAATQLPNGNMETWFQSDNGKNWELLYPGASVESSVWGTNNPMTTSQGSDYAYCRISGTIPTTDAHDGAKAALIRSVGWGSGNTATGSTGSKGITKYTDAGLLHLGSSRSTRPSGYSGREGALTTDDLNCGLAFASRPASLSFWYKYSPKNSSDKGVAEVYVYDASGSVLASATTTLASVSAYTQVTLPLSYGAGAAKAAKIYVKFLSTNDRSFLAKTDDNFSGPGFGNLSRGTFMGSQLYVDDINLNY